MIDVYLKSTNKDALDNFLYTSSTLNGLAIKTPNYPNVIPLAQGQAMQVASIDELGNMLPVQPSKGDPNYWYSCLRYQPSTVGDIDMDAVLDDLSLPNTIQICDTEEGRSVVGLWA